MTSTVRTKSPGRSWLVGRHGTVLAVRPANRLVRVDGQVRVRTVGRDQGARGVTAGAGPVLPPVALGVEGVGDRLHGNAPDRVSATKMIILGGTVARAASRPGDLPILRILSRIALAVAEREDRRQRTLRAEGSLESGGPHDGYLRVEAPRRQRATMGVAPRSGDEVKRHEELR